MMKKRILISVMCISLLFMLGGCESGKNGGEGAGGGNVSSEEILSTLEESEDVTQTWSYVDRQGTEDIYSQLDLVSQGDGLYDVTISLYRLAGLEGIAESDGNTLSFEDEAMKVKGVITIQKTGAVLTITESEFEAINQGNVFEFPEKLQ